MTWDGIDDSPRRIRALLENRGLALKKRWGQNFMISPAARTAIVDRLGPRPDEIVWEIGPGLGSITSILVERAAGVVVFEVDFGLIAIVRDRFADRVRIVEGDAVRTLPDAPGSPDRIAGNLPYRSASAIIATILESGRFSDVKRMVFTVQREMARRMVADPGTEDYSPFTVLCAVSAITRLESDLARGNFFPAPDVVSSVVTLEPRPVETGLQRTTSLVARALFAQRRKTIANNAVNLARELGLDRVAVHAALDEVGIDPASRAETLAPDRFVALARRVSAGATP